MKRITFLSKILNLTLFFAVVAALLPVGFTQNSNPRILVLIPEEVIRRPVPDPAAETEIMRALIAAGFRVLDLAQSERLEARELVKNLVNLTPQQLLDLSTRFGADLLVTGEAFAEEIPPLPGRDLRGMQLYQARLEVKVVDLATAQVAFSDAFVETGLKLGEAVAAKAALQNAGASAGEVLPSHIHKWVSGTGTMAGRAFVVKIENVPSFTAFSNLIYSIQSFPGVSAATSRQFDSASSEFEVEYQGSPQDLAILLESYLSLTITGLSAGEIRARYGQ